MILSMRQRVFSKLKLVDVPISSRLHNPAKRPVMTLIKRSANSIHARNRFDSARQWSTSFTYKLLSALSQEFTGTEHKISHYICAAIPWLTYLFSVLRLKRI